MNEFEISRYVRAYFIERRLVWPNVQEAMQWAHTEIGEAYEILLAQNTEWIRNNPEGKPKWSPEAFGEELGDAIMMLIMAGIVSGVDPIEQMIAKMRRKCPDVFNR